MNIFRADDYVRTSELVEVLFRRDDPYSVAHARSQGARSLMLYMYRINMTTARGVRFRFTGLPAKLDKQKAQEVAREMQGMSMDVLPEVAQSMEQIMGSMFVMEILDEPSEN